MFERGAGVMKERSVKCLGIEEWMEGEGILKEG